MNCQRQILLMLVCAVTSSLTIAAEPQLAHMVFFTLADDTPEHRQNLIAGCHEYLSGHEGEIYFSVGEIASDLNREVNDQEFDVALHIVFSDRKSHDTYQTHPRHLKFIAEHKQLWSAVRVFDSNVAMPVRDIDRFLAATLPVEVNQRSLNEAVESLANVYNKQHAGDPPIVIRLSGRDLQFEGITQNQMVRGVDPKGKTVAELLTDIVVVANPDRRAAGPNDFRQLLIWAVASDGKSVVVTTRRAAKKAGLTLPKVFQIAKP